jgi:UDP-glucose 4-epimerase
MSAQRGQARQDAEHRSQEGRPDAGPGTPSKRILITGLSTHWGGRLAQILEQDPEIETVIGVDRRPPKVELQRTEWVEVADSHSLIRRIVQGAEIDTVVDTRLVVDSVVTSPRRAHENNVIGTLNVLAACSGPDTCVKKFVFKSSAHYYGCEQDDPAYFTEEMRRPHPPRTALEADIVEAEAAVEDFAEKNPEMTVTVLRFANGLGPSLNTSHMRYLALPVVPTILGFDPRYQFIHSDDMAGVLEHAVRNQLDGVYNAAADGVLALTEVTDLLGKQWAPLLPPWGTSLAALGLRRAGLRIPPEMLQQLRFGRALDNRKLKAAGYRYAFTTRETVLKLREQQRLAPIVGKRNGDGYRYEREVEEFLRRSPSVLGRDRPAEPVMNVAAGGRKAAKPSRPSKPRLPAAVSGVEYDELEAEEVIALMRTFGPADLEALRRYEAGRGGRESVLRAIDSLLARARSPA